jgi:hypothetical protein
MLEIILGKAVWRSELIQVSQKCRSWLTKIKAERKEQSPLAKAQKGLRGFAAGHDGDGVARVVNACVGA